MTDRDRELLEGRDFPALLTALALGPRKAAGAQQVLRDPLMEELMRVCLLSTKPLNVKGFSKNVTYIFPSLPKSKSWRWAYLKVGEGSKQGSTERKTRRGRSPPHWEGHHVTHLWSHWSGLQNQKQLLPLFSQSALISLYSVTIAINIIFYPNCLVLF